MVLVCGAHLHLNGTICGDAPQGLGSSGLMPSEGDGHIHTEAVVQVQLHACAHARMGRGVTRVPPWGRARGFPHSFYIGSVANCRKDDFNV